MKVSVFLISYNIGFVYKVYKVNNNLISGILVCITHRIIIVDCLLRNRIKIMGILQHDTISLSYLLCQFAESDKVESAMMLTA